MQNDENITNLSINLLIPNAYQPRKVFNDQALEELANSIKEYGILNPILVRKKEDKYEIIAGERRYRAAKKIGLKEIPVIIKTMEDAKVAEVALIENLQRENITPIEEAKAYKEIIKLSKITQQKLSEVIGKSQSYIANKIRLLSLPEIIQDALSNKKISERHARSLMTIKEESRQQELLEKIIKEKLTVKELDNIINEKQINEEEIQAAINDIMKSLSLLEEPDDEEIKPKKEEKESDNMDNGNFFPNFNNTMGTNNNVSLNSMNMQTMNQNMAPMPPAQETVMPTTNQAPVMEQPVMENTINQSQNFGPIMQPVMPQPEIIPPVMNSEPVRPESPVIETPTSELPAMEQSMIEPIQPMAQPNTVINQQPVVEPQSFGMDPEISIISPEPNNINVQNNLPNTEPTPLNFEQDIPLFNEQSLMTEKNVDEFVNQIELPQNNSTPEISSMENSIANLNESSVEVSQEISPINNETPTPELPTQNLTPEINTIVTPQIIDTPLFSNPENIIQPTETSENQTINESFYEVPVNISPVIEDTKEENKLTTIQQLLSNNGIEYKSYSNDTGHCIIIEI